MRYFAYGSNMAASVMLTVCPGHRYLGAAQLAAHRLAFTRRSIRTGSGVADIVADPAAEVWGALYALPHDALDALDRKEGVDFAYERVPVRVQTPEGEELEAFAYAVALKEPVEITPSVEYLRGVLDAAIERALPAEYLRSLQALLER